MIDEIPVWLGYSGVSLMTQKPADHIVHPNVGNLVVQPTIKFPYYPAVFLTDITTNLNDTSGDAINGGTPIPPDEVYGSWIEKSPPANYFTGGANKTNLAGGDPWPPQSNSSYYYTPPGSAVPKLNVNDQTAYTAEIIWYIDTMTLNGQPLQHGHTYRAQITAHDGDTQFADRCVTVAIP